MIRCYLPVHVQVGDLITNRYYFSISVVGRQLVVAGGKPGFLSSIETLNSTKWVETNNLKIGRNEHSAVSVPAAHLSCPFD